MTSFVSALSNAISVILAVFFIPLSALTYGVDAISATARTDSSRINIAGIGAWFYSQGITTDCECFYFSSKNTLIKTREDKKTLINANYSAIPDSLRNEFNTAHIGGISYYNGRIYAGMEDSKIFEHPLIGVFDAQTLEMIEYHLLDDKDDEGNLLVKKGVPWVAVNPDTGFLYVAENNRTPEKIYYYDINDAMRKAGEIRINGEASMIQGAEFYNGKLLLSTNDETQAIYSLDTDTGIITKIFDRNLTYGSEGEGMTVSIKDGKPVISALDMGPLFVNAFVREYNIDM